MIGEATTRAPRLMEYKDTILSPCLHKQYLNKVKWQEDQQRGMQWRID
jgi:hypothetical protein